MFYSQACEAFPPQLSSLEVAEEAAQEQTQKHLLHVHTQLARVSLSWSANIELNLEFNLCAHNSRIEYDAEVLNAFQAMREVTTAPVKHNKNSTCLAKEEWKLKSLPVCSLERSETIHFTGVNTTHTHPHTLGH